MSITVSFTPETEAMIRQRAGAAGKAVDAFVQEAVQEKLQAPRSFRELLSPVQDALAGHGMDDEQLAAMFDQLRDRSL